ncbi:hypothetical protein MRX96_051147 [Rhipicephalus microplus]
MVVGAAPVLLVFDRMLLTPNALNSTGCWSHGLVSETRDHDPFAETKLLKYSRSRIFGTGTTRSFPKRTGGRSKLEDYARTTQSQCMEYFLEKLRMSRSTKDDETPPPSPYADQQRRPSRLLGCQLHYPSPTFIDRVLLARSLKVRRTEGEGVAEFSNSEFVQECLRTHNELRLRHEVPPLRLCSKVRIYTAPQ